MNIRLVPPVLLCLVSLTNANAADVQVVFQQGSRGYAGTQDVTISSDGRIESINLGGSTQIGIYYDGTCSLIRFDLSAVPQNALVKDASLELYCHSVGFAPDEKARKWPVEVHECTHEWKEGTGVTKEKPKKDGATMKTYDGTHEWPNKKVAYAAGELLATTIHEGDQSRWYSWELKPEVVQRWVEGTQPNNGFIVGGQSPGKAVSFTAKDSTAGEMRPILRLTLSLPEADIAKMGRLAASEIAWPQFVADCGKKAQEANEARTEQVFEEKYAGKTVFWTGTVDGIKRKPIGSGYSVFIRMDPTESAFGTYDLVLDAPESLSAKVLSFNKGQRVEFSAKFARQGGVILGHSLDLLGIDSPATQVSPQPSSTRRKR